MEDKRQTLLRLANEILNETEPSEHLAKCNAMFRFVLDNFNPIRKEQYEELSLLMKTPAIPLDNHDMDWSDEVYPIRIIKIVLNKSTMPTDSIVSREEFTKKYGDCILKCARRNKII